MSDLNNPQDDAERVYPTIFDQSGYADKNVIDPSEEACEAPSGLLEL